MKKSDTPLRSRACVFLALGCVALLFACSDDGGGSPSPTDVTDGGDTEVFEDSTDVSETGEVPACDDENPCNPLVYQPCQQVEGEPACVLKDLEMADLSGEDLSGLDMRGVNMPNADLSGATLIGTDLREGAINGVNFVGANLTAADLRDADARNGRFKDANLTDAKLDGAIFTFANFDNTICPRGNIGTSIRACTD